MSSSIKEISVVLFMLMLSICYSMGLVSSIAFLDIQLFVLTLILCINFKRNKRITLLQVWVFSFIYIIWSDMMLCAVYDMHYDDSIVFLTYANLAVVLSYLLTRPQITFSRKNYSFEIVNKRRFIALICISVVLYLYKSIPAAIENMVLGRQLTATTGSGSILGLVSTACGLIAPTLIAYYCFNIKQAHKWRHLWLCLPLFIVQVCITTRYLIIYQVIPYLITVKLINLNNQKLKDFVYLIIIILLLSSVSSTLKDSRRYGLKSYFQSEYVLRNDESVHKRWDERLAEGMSPEGIVKMTDLSHQYFKQGEHSYGREITFMFYFWIPRAIWHNKPLPIDYWLIRKYEDVDDAYSSASGFTGEIYADFGLFCFVILFLFGYILKRCDKLSLVLYNVQQNDFNQILSALVYPCAFFFVRSPLTAMECFFVELFLFFLIRKTCCCKFIP